MSLAERVERAALKEAKAFFAEKLRARYRMSQASTDHVLQVVARYLMDQGSERDNLRLMVRPGTESILDHVYVAVKQRTLVFVVDDDDDQDITVDDGVTYFRIPFAVEQAARTVAYDPSITQSRRRHAEFSTIARHLRPRATPLPR